MPYFECNLPRQIPFYYAPEIHDKLQSCVDLVYERTEKLNRALDIASAANIKPATFHKLAKQIFDLSSKRFDELNAEELAKTAIILYDGTEAPDRLEWPNTIALYDTAFVSTKDWEALRHFGIGGSDSSVVMGVSPYQTEEGLWYDKLGYPEKVTDPGKQAIFDRGHFLEPKVIEAFCKMTGAVVIPETRMFASKKHPHSTANLDGVLRMPSGKIVIFEAKSAIDCYAKVEEWFGDNVPANYITQIHQYLGVLDDDRVEGVYIGMLPCTDYTLADIYIGSEYDTGKYFHHFEPRDEIYEEEILCTEEAFWTDYVETGVKPAPSKDSELDRTVAIRYTPTPISEPNTPPIQLDYELNEDLYNRLCSADEQVKLKQKELDSLTNFRDSLRNEFIEQMGGSQEAQLVDSTGTPRFIVKNTLIRKTTADMSLLETYFPDAYEKCKKVSSYTKFTTKAAKKPKK